MAGRRGGFQTRPYTPGWSESTLPLCSIFQTRKKSLPLHELVWLQVLLGGEEKLAPGRLSQLGQGLSPRVDNRFRTRQLRVAVRHQTEKPVEVAARAIQYSSRRGENVLDLFGGSGSTLIAAEQLERKAFLMEIDPLYCDVIVERWENFTGRKANRA